MAITINRRLNIVFSIERSDGVEIHVHATPISRAVYERYFEVVGKAFHEIFKDGSYLTLGSRTAALIMRKYAREHDILDGLDGVERGLFGEMRRLSNVVVPGRLGGWDIVQLSDALQGGMIDDEDIGEVDNILAFFTAISWVQRRQAVATHLMAMRAYGVTTTPCDATEWANSLPTLTPAESIGETMPASLVPS